MQMQMKRKGKSKRKRQAIEPKKECTRFPLGDGNIPRQDRMGSLYLYRGPRPTPSAGSQVTDNLKHRSQYYTTGPQGRDKHVRTNIIAPSTSISYHHSVWRHITVCGGGGQHGIPSKTRPYRGRAKQRIQDNMSIKQINVTLPAAEMCHRDRVKRHAYLKKYRERYSKNTFTTHKIHQYTAILGARAFTG
jgi:hypothetical protein